MTRFLLLALGLLALPAFAQPAAPTPTSAASAAPVATSFLWRVEGAQATHYLLGSVHLLPAVAQPLPAAIQRAYADSERLVLETDPDALAKPEIQQQFLGAAHRDATNPAQQFGEALSQQLKLQAQRSGLPATVCDAYRAWFCALTLEIIAFQRAGFEAQYGVDQQIHERGSDDDKAFAFLETTAQHLGLFTAMDPLDGRALLTQTLDDLDSEAGNAPETMLAAWMSNDTTSVGTELLDLQQRAPAVYARLMRDRNRAWLPRLDEYFRSKLPTLVVVGAAHLLGPDGLVSTLRQAGWTVVPVEFGKPAMADEPVAGPAAVEAPGAKP